MDHTALARSLALATYGSDAHTCRFCDEALTDVVVAARVHTLAVEHVTEGDLLCPTCAADLADDGETILRESAELAARYLETVARHPATVSLALRLPRLAALMAAGLLLAACDVAELDARADAAREAWIAAMEAEGDPSPPPWSSQWDPGCDALCGRRAA